MTVDNNKTLFIKVSTWFVIVEISSMQKISINL